MRGGRLAVPATGPNMAWYGRIVCSGYGKSCGSKQK